MGHDHSSNAYAQIRMSIFFSDVDATDSCCNNLLLRVPSAALEIYACDLQALWQEA